jgi:hypothetical protein
MKKTDNFLIYMKKKLIIVLKGEIKILFSIFYAYYFQLNLLIFLVSISKNLNIK